MESVDEMKLGGLEWRKRQASATRLSARDGMTYHQALVEREHDNELDRQELGQRAFALQLFLGKLIEDDQAVQRNSVIYTRSAQEGV